MPAFRIKAHAGKLNFYWLLKNKFITALIGTFGKSFTWLVFLKLIPKTPLSHEPRSNKIFAPRKLDLKVGQRFWYVPFFDFFKYADQDFVASLS